jgi:hypothetical protein
MKQRRGNDLDKIKAAREKGGSSLDDLEVSYAKQTIINPIIESFGR